MSKKRPQSFFGKIGNLISQTGPKLNYDSGTSSDSSKSSASSNKTTRKRKRSNSSVTNQNRTTLKNKNLDNLDKLNNLIDSLVSGDVGLDNSDNIHSERQKLFKKTSNVKKSKTLHDNMINQFEELKANIEEKINNASENIKKEEKKMVEYKSMIMNEQASMLELLNETMKSNQSKLSRGERFELNQKVIEFIITTTNEIIGEKQHKLFVELIENEKSILYEAIRNLFNGIIEWTATIASYGYNNRTKILVKIGSVIGGAAIIGSQIFKVTKITNISELLVLLSGYLQSDVLRTSTTMAFGLYLLKVGGLPVTQILKNIGGFSANYAANICNNTLTDMKYLWKLSIDSLSLYITKDYQNLEFEIDMRSGKFSLVSSKKSLSSNKSSSSKSSAKQTADGIEEVLNVPINEQINILLEETNNNNIPNVVEIKTNSVTSTLTEDSHARSKSPSK